MMGGPAGVAKLASCLMTIGPGVAGLGGFKYLMESCCTLSAQSAYLSLTTSGLGSTFTWYSLIGISPFQLSTSALFSQMPRTPFISITSTSLVAMGRVDLRIDSSNWLTYGGRLLSPQHGSGAAEHGAGAGVLVRVTVCGVACTTERVPIEMGTDSMVRHVFDSFVLIFWLGDADFLGVEVALGTGAFGISHTTQLPY